MREREREMWGCNDNICLNDKINTSLTEWLKEKITTAVLVWLEDQILTAVTV